MLIDSPVGTPAERALGFVWPGAWFDWTPFGMRYEVVAGRWARHTGADLNLNEPHWNADAGAPVYAIADGKVTASRLGRSTWGWIIVIEHVNDEGNLFYSRYAHVNHIQFPVVKKGDEVTIGSVIAHIGNADGLYGDGHHLHFDISHTKVLKSNPEHWPGDTTEAKLRRNYSDPRRFIMEHRTEPIFGDDSPIETMQVTSTTLNIRPRPNLLRPRIGHLRYGDVVEIRGSFSGSGYKFAELLKVDDQAFSEINDERGFIAREFLTPVS